MIAGSSDRRTCLLLAGAARLPLVCILLASAAGCRSINTAAQRGDIATVQKLLDQGCDPDQRNWRNSRPLLAAASSGHLDMVKLLVERGADVDRTGDTFQTPLHHAVQIGHVAMVKYLLAHGASPKWGLNEAVRSEQVEVARVLLSQKVDTEQEGYGGGTPLQWAVARGNPELVELLLAHGVRANSSGDGGRAPLHMAASRGDLTIGRILLKHGAAPVLTANGEPAYPCSKEFRALLLAK